MKTTAADCEFGEMFDVRILDRMLEIALITETALKENRTVEVNRVQRQMKYFESLRKGGEGRISMKENNSA